MLPAELCHHFWDSKLIIFKDKDLPVGAVNAHIDIEEKFSLDREVTVLVPFKLIAYLLATLLVLFLLVSNLPAKSHSCQGLIHVFDIKIGFYLLLDLRC